MNADKEKKIREIMKILIHYFSEEMGEGAPYDIACEIAALLPETPKKMKAKEFGNLVEQITKHPTKEQRQMLREMYERIEQPAPPEVEPETPKTEGYLSFTKRYNKFMGQTPVTDTDGLVKPPTEAELNTTPLPTYNVYAYMQGWEDGAAKQKAADDKRFNDLIDKARIADTPDESHRDIK